MNRANRIRKAVLDVRLTRRGKLRAALIFCGSILLIATLVAGWLRSGFPGGFSARQIILILVGLILILSGWLEEGIFVLYRSISLLLLNTIVLIALAELGATAIARSGFFPSYLQTALVSYQNLPYYASQDWSEKFFQEANHVENYQYHPYNLWRHRPFDGDLINVNRDSIRETPGADCIPAAYKVFAFGGSTMWGWGSPDWGTIPAFLQTGLEPLVEGPVCVINFGEDGYVSTQSVIELARQLHLGNIPDAVVFYDGFNDVFAAYESGQPGVHTSLESTRARFEPREHPMLEWVKSSHLFWLAGQLVSPSRQSGTETLRSQRIDWENPSEIERLAESVLAVYLSNFRVVNALADEYDFDGYFFWQPHLAVGGKRLTREELAILSAMDPRLSDLANLVYAGIAGSTGGHARLWDISNSLDNQEDQIWIDIWGHVTPEGNRIIAGKMMEIIGVDLRQD